MTVCRRPHQGSFWIALDTEQHCVIVGRAVKIEDGLVSGLVCSEREPRGQWRAVPEDSILSAITMEERVLCEGALFNSDAIRSMPWYQDLLVARQFERLTAPLET